MAGALENRDGWVGGAERLGRDSPLTGYVNDEVHVVRFHEERLDEFFHVQVREEVEDGLHVVDDLGDERGVRPHASSGTSSKA